MRIFAVIITGRPVMIITEFMHNGALSNYLVVSILHALHVTSIVYFFPLPFCNVIFYVT